MSRRTNRSKSLYPTDARRFIEEGLAFRLRLRAPLALIDPTAPQYKAISAAHDALDRALVEVAGRPLEYNEANLGLLDGPPLHPGAFNPRPGRSE